MDVVAQGAEAFLGEHGLAKGTMALVGADDAERLYARLGWTRVGVVPEFALWPDGRPCDTTFFYKRADAAAERRDVPVTRPAAAG